MTLAKSAKWRSRQRAYEAGELYQWEKARAAVTQSELRTAPPAPDFSVSTVEGTEWREGERYPRFILPINSYRRGDGDRRSF
jgi:hypothetical protein